MVFTNSGDGSTSGLTLFSIDNTGLITTTGLLDRDGGLTYFDLTVKAADDGSPVNSVTGTMTVTLTAVNEHTPAFTKSIYYASVGEGDAADTR